MEQLKKTTLLVLNAEYSLDKTTIYANNIRSDNKFFENYLSIAYTKENKTKILKLKNRTTPYLKNTLVFELRNEIMTADSIDLLVTIRNKRYTIELK